MSAEGGCVVKRFLLAASLLSLSFATPVAAQNVGGWQVGLWETDGQYNGCRMRGEFSGGTTIAIAVKAEGGWVVLLKNDTWKVNEGSSLKASLLVDGRVVASGNADVHANQIIALNFDGGQATYNALQAGLSMQVKTDVGDTHKFSLRGTRVAMDAVLQCVANNKHRYQPPRGGQQQAQNQGQQGQQNRGTQNQGGAQPIPAVEAMTIITNILASSGATGYRIEPPKNDTISWVGNDGTRGSFFGFRNYTAQPEDAVASVFRVVSENCKGEVGTIKRSVPTLDGSIVRKLIVACRDGQSVTETSFTMIHRAGVLMVIEYSGAGAGAGGQPQSQEASVVDAALSYASKVR
jgi:hypothetical protein